MNEVEVVLEGKRKRSIIQLSTMKKWKQIDLHQTATHVPTPSPARLRKRHLKSSHHHEEELIEYPILQMLLPTQLKVVAREVENPSCGRRERLLL